MCGAFFIRNFRMTTKQPDWEAIERAYRAGLDWG